MNQNTAKFLFLIVMIVLAVALTACGQPQSYDGKDGSPGSDGYTPIIYSALADPSLCPNGGYVLTTGLDLNRDKVISTSEIRTVNVICNGLDGQNGLNGSNGTNGSNGADGKDGKDAPPTPLTPVAILAPCAKDPMHPTASELSNPALEVFVQLADGTILDSFSETIAGYNTHFGILSPGNYMSTGAGNCSFHVSNTGLITR